MLLVASKFPQDPPKLFVGHQEGLFHWRNTLVLFSWTLRVLRKPGDDKFLLCLSGCDARRLIGQPLEIVFKYLHFWRASASKEFFLF